ncbi:MAG: hypothetical protein AAGC71_02555 [Pseudomonadota bacterium]
MSIDPAELDTHERDLFGTLDRLVTDALLIVIGLVPTLFVCVGAPARLLPLLTGPAPRGRTGLLLGAGIYFLVAFLLVLGGVGALLPSEASAAANDDSLSFGLGDAKAIFDFSSGGELGRAVVTMAPMFAVTLVIATSTQAARWLAGTWWTWRVAVRASLYWVTTLTTCVFIGFGVLNLLGRSIETIGSLTPLLNGLAALHFVAFFMRLFGSRIPRWRALLAAVVAFIATICFIAVTAFASWISQ